METAGTEGMSTTAGPNDSRNASHNVNARHTTSEGTPITVEKHHEQKECQQQDSCNSRNANISMTAKNSRDTNKWWKLQEQKGCQWKQLEQK
jgi:hypothetical protein